MHLLDVNAHWDGRPLPSEHWACVELELTPAALRIRFDAPWYDDPSPPVHAGSVDRLWEYEVLELFVAGPGDAYLELELGPGGHYLGLQLDGVRSVRRSGISVEYHVPNCTRGTAGVPGRYVGAANVALDVLPLRPWRANAYLIHGVGAARCYHAHAPVPGPAPDFHQPTRFVPIDP